MLDPPRLPYLMLAALTVTMQSNVAAVHFQQVGHEIVILTTQCGSSQV